jgi:hypothetical protein
VEVVVVVAVVVVAVVVVAVVVVAAVVVVGTVVVVCAVVVVWVVVGCVVVCCVVDGCVVVELVVVVVVDLPWHPDFPGQAAFALADGASATAAASPARKSETMETAVSVRDVFETPVNRLRLASPPHIGRSSESPDHPEGAGRHPASVRVQEYVRRRARKTG